MKVLFIKPPNRGLNHEIIRFIPIGLAYLAAACRVKGHDVRIFDSLTYFQDNRVLHRNELSEVQRRKVDSHPVIKNIIHWGASYDRIRQELVEQMPEVVCITSMHSPSYDTAYETARIVKQTLPDAVTIIGGSHASIAYEHIIDHTDINYIVLAEGENSLPQLLHNLECNQSPTDIDGIVFRIDDQDIANRMTKGGISYYYNPKIEWISNLDNNLYPAVDLLDFEKYDETSVLITSRGCPFSCSFCTVHATVGKEYRYRSAENVVAEIEWYINNYNIRKFNIEDDNFTMQIGRAKEIFDLIIQKKLDIEINLLNGIMVFNMDEDLAEKMLQAGVKFLFFGLETTSDEKLSGISKSHTSLTLVEKALGWFKKRGFIMGASLIIGFPNQTLDDMVSDIVCLIKRNIEFGSPNPFYPIIGSVIYSNCVYQGYVHPNEDLTWFCEFNFPIQTNNFSRKDIYDLWSACNAIHQWPQILQAYRLQIPQSNRVRFFVCNLSASDSIVIKEKSISFIPEQGSSYSEANRINPDNENGDVFIDAVTGDLIANMIYLLSGEPHKAVQTKSILNADAHNEFQIYKCEANRSRVLDSLNNKLKDEFIKEGKI